MEGVLFLGVTGWMVCGLIAALIGSTKGEGCLAFILGCFFGPLGILFAILSSGDRRPCPYCAEKIQKKARLCPHCRTQLS